MADGRRDDEEACPPTPGPRALLVFEDRAESILLRRLRPGFRHCFCLVQSGANWIVCDPLKTRVELTLVTAPNAGCLALQLARPGRIVLVGEVGPATARRRPRLRPFTCVEAVMRVLCIEAGLVLTPYQLFRHLLGSSAPRRWSIAADAGAEIHLDRVGN